uniref:Bm7799 n=1 Tax=Brugia malayi TaxID=6279 RepID=A0A0H5RZG1_BRUMA|nr:Bm7799 [Brugia malayi]
MLLIYTIMILPQVHLRKPCYDFCPVQATAIKAVSTKESLPLKGIETAVSAFLETAQSRAATGGVYKGQGRNQRELMTHTY